MPYYVEIPYQKIPALQFPQICAFSGHQDPDSHRKLTGTTRYSGLSIPGVPFMITKGRTIMVKMPVSADYLSRRGGQFRLGMSLLAVAFFSAWFEYSQVSLPLSIVKWIWLTRLLLAVLGGGLLLLSCTGKSKAWIDYVGERSMELAFKNREFARQFADLNDLRSRWRLVNFRLS